MITFVTMSSFIKLYKENPNIKKIQTVVDILQKGGVIIYPTDTVYGLGCDITKSKALKRVAQLKNVKLEKAYFSFICHNLNNISDYVKQLNTQTFKTLKRNIPGPYTFILPGNNKLPKEFKKRKTIGIRVPDNNIIQTIVKELGNPIVSTSIYDEDKIIEYTTNPELIFEKWGKLVDLVIDGGYGGNIASTVIDLCGEEPKLIRSGGKNFDDFY